MRVLVALHHLDLLDLLPGQSCHLLDLFLALDAPLLHLFDLLHAQGLRLHLIQFFLLLGKSLLCLSLEFTSAQLVLQFSLSAFLLPSILL